MAIIFPIEQPIKFTQSEVESAAIIRQVVHLRDEGMYQFYDPLYSQHRVIILDDEFTPTYEIDLTDSIEYINNNYVYTPEINWSTVSSVGDRVYVGVVDANSNKYMQNYMPNGGFASSDLWTYGEKIGIASNQMTFTSTAGSQSDSATFSLPLRVGSGYTVTIDIDSISGTNQCVFKNGSTTIGTASVGDNTFAFTAVENDLVLSFSSLDAGNVVVNEMTCKMDYEDVVPEFISSPFCVKDVESTMSIIHGCSNNDYFNMYFASTGFTPRLRVFSEIYDTTPIQDVSRAYLSNGRIRNYYARHISAREVRIEWLPAYLINFMSIVFLLDQSYIDNEAYDLVEDVTVVADASSPEIKAYNLTVARRLSAASYKRVVNDPDENACIIPLGAYVNRYTEEIYVQRQTDENYYPRQ